MGRKKTILTPLLAGLGIMILILDSKTAVQAAADALEICIRTVIPSLFPLFVFSILLTGSMDGQSLFFLRPIGKLCGLPDQSEALLLTGFLGGYPAGAQCVSQAYTAGTLNKSDASRILPVCNNAGPAFIFGIISTLFTSSAAPWVLWLIQILSAVCLGWILSPGKTVQTAAFTSNQVSITQALRKSISAMSSVCGWILLFRCLVAFIEKWFLWLLPKTLQAVLVGCLELTNGCWFLQQIDSEILRFILCSAFLSFGGLCVFMQTLAVVGDLGLRTYLPGKLLQTLISTVLSICAVPILFECSIQVKTFSILSCIVSVFFLIGIKYAGKFKKRVAIRKIKMYND